MKIAIFSTANGYVVDPLWGPQKGKDKRLKPEIKVGDRVIVQIPMFPEHEADGWVILPAMFAQASIEFVGERIIGVKVSSTEHQPYIPHPDNLIAIKPNQIYKPC